MTPAASADPGPPAGDDGPAPTTPDGDLATPPGTKRFLAGVAVLSVALVALVLLAALLVVDRAGEQRRADSDRAALDAARDVTVRLGSLSADGLQTQIDGLLARSSGRFREQVVGTAAFLRDVTAAARFRSTAVLTSAGIESNDEQRAVVLLTSVSRVSNSEIPQGDERRYRQVVNLSWDGSRWLVDNVENPV